MIGYQLEEDLNSIHVHKEARHPGIKANVDGIVAAINKKCRSRQPLTLSCFQSVSKSLVPFSGDTVDWKWCWGKEFPQGDNKV